ncbi:MAG: tetratricopeptide repeat protein [Pleurocapsa minor GSE-CHR-MK-17-07R]|nr:tetratricopeptide repeat protein [Pleurocapsa minor GSE-CHR-MK 17-07R]
MGHYLRSSEPLVQLWAIGGDELLQRLYDEAILRYEAQPKDKSHLIFAVNLSDFLMLLVWRAAVERVKADLPNHPFTELVVGSYLVRTGEKEEAKPYMDRALAMDAGNPDMVAICASMYALDWKMPQRGLEMIHQAMAAEPDVAWYHIVRGDIYGIALNDHAAAFKDYDRAVELSPDHYPFRNMRAAAQIELGNHAAAITDLEYALKVNPDSPNGRFSLLKCYLSINDMRGAADALLAPRTYLQDVRALDTGDPITLPILPNLTHRLAFSGNSGESVKITAESDDARLVAPFTALIGPDGSVIAHSVLYASQADTPDARVTLTAVLADTGSYTCIVCQNLGTWESLGEGELRVTLTVNDPPAS